MAFQFREQLGYLVNRCAIALRAELQDRFLQKGFIATGVDWAILALLLTEGRLSQKEIAAMSTKDSTTVTRQIEKLVKRGLIVKEKDKSDLRVTYIELSDSGRDFVQQLVPIVQNLIGYLTEDVSKSDMEATKRCLKKVLQKLTGE